jgi:hypothetical protein
MRRRSNLICLASVTTLLLLVCGCSRAPLMDVDGSFMPAWMICLMGGIVVAGLTKWQLLRREMQHRVTLAVIFYPSVVVATSCLLWLLFF